jgi:hypothetical protein
VLTTLSNPSYYFVVRSRTMTTIKRTSNPVRGNLAKLTGAVILISLITACKNPEIERIGAAKIEQDRIAAAEEAEAARQKAEEKKRQEAESADDAALSPERERADAATRSFRIFLDRIMSDPSVEPRQYVAALREVSVDGDTLSLSLSMRDREEARKLCNVALLAWTDRAKHGILNVRVSDMVSDSVLAMSTESGVCE